MVKKTPNEFIADELAFKVKQLYKALNQAEDIILKLEIENEKLKDVLNSLTSLNKEGYHFVSESVNGSICTA